MARADVGEEGLVSQLNIDPLHESNFNSWYHFVLSYSPSFVDYEIKKQGLEKESIILDPFVGCGTTLVQAKKLSIGSIGIEANSLCEFASKVKLDWTADPDVLKAAIDTIISSTSDEMKLIESCSDLPNDSHWGCSDIRLNSLHKSLLQGLSSNTLILDGHISPKPLCKLLVIKRVIDQGIPKLSQSERDALRLAIVGITVPSSNIRFGPTPGKVKAADDIDVVSLFKKKVEDMIRDLSEASRPEKAYASSNGTRGWNYGGRPKSEVILGDARESSSYPLEQKLKWHHFDSVITSPPYPAEHEYTRHTRLEMVFMEQVRNNEDLRAIKKSMVRGSTRNIYKDDDESQIVSKFESIQKIVREIDSKVEASKIRDDGEVRELSGFEKLYSRVVSEYFGGMYKCLENIHSVLKEGKKAALLVGDSRTYKMTYVPTAEILGEMALDIGFESFEIELWRNSRSTAHNLDLNENILRLVK